MSVQLARYPSEEAPPFGPKGRYIMNLVVPSSAGFTDTKNSTVVFQTELPVHDNSGGVDIILPATFTSYVVDGMIRPTGAQVMIRNSRSWSDMLPQTEQVQQNIFRTTLDEYTKSRAQVSAESILGSAGVSYNYGTIGQSGLPDVPDILYSRPTAFDTVLTTPSQKVAAEYHIPLKHLDAMGEFMSQFPNLAVGDKYYRVELEQQNQIVTPCVMPKEIDIESMAPSGGTIGTSDNKLITTTKYPHLSDFNNIPLYVSAPITFTYADSSADEHTSSSTITALDVSSGSGAVLITVDPPIEVLGLEANNGSLNYYGDTHTDNRYLAPPSLTKVSTDTSLSVTYRIINAYVQPQQLVLTPEQFSRAQEALKDLSLQFYEYKVFTRNLANANSYNDTVPIPTGASDVALMTPYPGELVSTSDSADFYRFTVDGKTTTDRSIFVGAEGNGGATNPSCRQIHNDRLAKYFLNGGQALRRFDCPNLSYGSYATVADATFYPQILLPGTSNITVEVISEANDMSDKTTYWVFRIPRVLQFKNGRPQLL